MHKKLISYCFIVLLSFTIITPTYFILNESITIKLVENNNEEEGKNGKKLITEIEIKTYLILEDTIFFLTKELKNQITFFSKQYTSAFLRIDIPPPQA